MRWIHHSEPDGKHQLHRRTNVPGMALPTCSASTAPARAGNSRRWTIDQLTYKCGGTGQSGSHTREPFGVMPARLFVICKIPFPCCLHMFPREQGEPSQLSACDASFGLVRGLKVQLGSGEPLCCAILSCKVSPGVLHSSQLNLTNMPWHRELGFSAPDRRGSRDCAINYDLYDRLDVFAALEKHRPCGSGARRRSAGTSILRRYPGPIGRSVSMSARSRLRF